MFQSLSYFFEKKWNHNDKMKRRYHIYKKNIEKMDKKSSHVRKVLSKDIHKLTELIFRSRSVGEI
jgi:hypothetical protein